MTISDPTEFESAGASSSSMSRRSLQTFSVISIAILSGFAGLGYEIVWTRMLAVSLGHEIVAVLGVISALFAGLALGSLVPGRQIAASERPALWYGVLELVIGLWALALIPLFPLAGDLVPVLVPIDATAGLQWFVAFGLPFVVLLPATTAMGATLPALDAVLASQQHRSGTVGRVYAANTLGAVCGTLVTTFLLIPSVGLSVTLALCAAINGLCAIALWSQGEVARVIPARVQKPRMPFKLAPLFLTGLLGIGYEVLTIRVISQILENTLYTFALLLAAYLFGTACGATLRNRLARSSSNGGALTTVLVITTSLACIGGAIVLASSEAILSTLQGLLPKTMAGRLGAEFGIAAAAFLPPTIAMGALFTQLAQLVRDRDGNLSTALAVNTLGAALAPVLFGPLLIPLVGTKTGFVLIALSYLLVLPNVRWLTISLAALTSTAAIALTLSPLSLRFVKVPPGGELVWHRDGVMAAVSVISNRGGDLHLQVNNNFRMGGTASIRSDYREAHIPLLLHPNPKRALFLGLGTGATLSAAGDHPGLIADGVELVPEVVESFSRFEKSAPNLGRNSGLHVHVADARRFARAAHDRYDVIVADLYHPSVDGSGALYAKEHFAAIHARLAEGGMFTQWLPLHQLDLATLRVIVRTFLSEFPNASAYLAQFSVETPLIALVGTNAPMTYPAEWLGHRVKDGALRAKLAAIDLKDEIALFGLYLAGADQLRSFAGPGPVNSDDKPFVTAEAPRTAYVTTEAPGARLISILNELKPKPGDILHGADADTLHRLAAYWSARDRFLEIGVRTLAGGDPRNVIAGVAPQLIDVVRTSGDFDAAYMPVIAMARKLALSDPSSARRLLEALAEANPARPEARHLLSTLPQR